MEWRTTARRQHGVLTSRQAYAAGLTPAAVRWQVTSGRWQSLGRGLFLTHSGELDWHARASAAVLRAGDGAVVTGTSAAYLRGLLDRTPTRVTIAIPTRRRVVPLAWTDLQRRDGLPATTCFGLPVLPAAWTALDLGHRRGATWRDAVAECARAVQRRRCTVRQLRDALAEWPRHRHRRALEVALTAVDQGAESVLEVSYLQRVQQRHRLPAVAVQAPGRSAAGPVRRDFRYESYAVVVEVDGRLGHEGAGLWRDRRRDREAARSGVITVRAGWADVESAPCELAADVVGVLRSRGYAGPVRACGPSCDVRRVDGDTVS